MKKSYFLFLVGAFVSMCTTALAWEKPAAPAVQALVTDGETWQYIFNPGADGFLCGANDYNTRASVSLTRGYKWKVLMTDEANPYFALIDSIEYDNGGKPCDWGWRRMFCDNATGIWVDNDGGANNDTWTISAADNKFKIGNNAIEGFLAIRPAEKNDTRCYFTSAEAYVAETMSDEWYATSQDEFLRYSAAKPIYNAAMDLKAALDAAKAEYPSIDVTAEEKVFNNESSTIEELNAATAEVTLKVKEEAAKKLAEGATWDSPKSMTSLIDDPSFEKGDMGSWTTAGSGGDCGVKENSNGTYHCDNADGEYLFNTWGRSPLVVNQKLERMPNGIYKLTALYASDKGNVGLLYANTDTTNINADDAGKTMMVEGTVAAIVTDKTVNIGMTSEQWFKADNFRLDYCGNDAQSYQEYVKAQAPAFSEEDQITTSLLEDYNANVASKAAAVQTPEEAKAAAAEIKQAAALVEENKALWAELAKKVETAKSTLTDPALDQTHEAVLELSDYVDMGYDEIRGAKALTSEELKAEVEKVQTMINKAMQALKDGADMTKYLKNPQMDSAAGWEGNPVINEACGEKYGVNGDFDVYQIVDAEMPVGVYEIEMQGFYRQYRDDNAEKQAWYNVFEATDDAHTYKEGKPVPLAFVYLNANKTAMNCVYDFTREGVYDPDTQTFTCDFYGSGYSVDPYNKYAYPNNMATAAKAFAVGAYKVSAYGILAKESDKLRIGVKGNLGGNDWAIFDNFKLTFRAKNEELVDKLLPDAVAALDLTGKTVGKDVKESVTAALAAAQSAQTVDEKFNALADCSNLTETVEKSVALFQELYTAMGDLETAVSNSKASAEVIAEGSKMLEDVSSAYAGGAYTDAEAEATINDIDAMVKKLAIPENIGTDDEPVDFTTFIKDAGCVNLPVSGSSYGAWTWEKNGGNGPAHGSGSEFWNGSASNLKFQVYQVVSGLPSGKYGLTVQAANSYNGQAPLGNSGRAYLFAEIAGSTVIPSVAIEPQDAEATATNEVKVIFTLGKSASEATKQKATATEDENIVTVGIKTVGTMDARWFFFKEFKLECYGTESKQEDTPDAITPATAIKDVVAAETESAPVAVYNAVGVQIPGITKGLNIVRMSDGTVRKVLVK